MHLLVKSTLLRQERGAKTFHISDRILQIEVLAFLLAD